jgi:hypothetical protein
VLEKTSLSVGKLITGGATFAMGVKDRSIHVNYRGYLRQLQWTEKKHVVLWDEGDKRGWLVNGTSVLLHLVRAYLDYSGQSRLSASFLFTPEKLKEAAPLHKPFSALEVLANQANCVLPIYADKYTLSEEVKAPTDGVEGSSDEPRHTTKLNTEYFLFQNVVEQYYGVLEQVFDYQEQVAGRDGIKLKARVRKHLEGWDFKELVTGVNFRPRVATLQALGWGWVDFIRTIGAITLFGKGFGELLKPAPTSSICPQWETLPKGRYYLAASAFDFKNIVEDFGDGTNYSRIEDLRLHNQSSSGQRCPCKQAHCRPSIIGFLPVSAKFGRDSASIQKPPNHDGAMVFGHCHTWPYRWVESGDRDVEAAPKDRVDSAVNGAIPLGVDSEPSTISDFVGSSGSNTCSSLSGRDDDLSSQTSASPSTVLTRYESIDSVFASGATNVAHHTRPHEESRRTRDDVGVVGYAYEGGWQAGRSETPTEEDSCRHSRPDWNGTREKVEVLAMRQLRKEKHRI